MMVCRMAHGSLLGNALKFSQSLSDRVEFWWHILPGWWRPARVWRRYIEDIVSNAKLILCSRIRWLRVRAILLLPGVGPVSSIERRFCRARLGRARCGGCPCVPCRWRGSGRLRMRIFVLLACTPLERAMRLEETALFLLDHSLLSHRWRTRDVGAVVLLSRRSIATGWLEAGERGRVGVLALAVSALGASWRWNSASLRRRPQTAELCHNIGGIRVVRHLRNISSMALR